METQENGYAAYEEKLRISRIVGEKDARFVKHEVSESQH